ncbi:hypothetical protein Syun_014834 [Stephania yunnanensis]|uniref:Uncharacterized protein n=1 Tax=Stephania yunnanensis TaxID=152371 RepID=A0AAP0P9Z7_9MAGN
MYMWSAYTLLHILFVDSTLHYFVYMCNCTFHIYFKILSYMMYEEASQFANDAVGSIRTVASFCAEDKSRTRIASTVKAIVDERIGNGEVSNK